MKVLKGVGHLVEQEEVFPIDDGAAAGVDQALKQLPQLISFRLQSCNGGDELIGDFFR